MSQAHSAETPSFDLAKIDQAVLALLHLNSWTEHVGPRGGGLSATLAWKSLNWDSLDRLHARGLISDPKRAAKSLTLTPEGARLASRTCREMFAAGPAGNP